MAYKFDIEEYIKDLTPEQQEKARACKTKDELMKLAADEGVEIPMEALANVAGGCDTTELYCEDCSSTIIAYDYYLGHSCAKCGSTNIGMRVVSS